MKKLFILLLLLPLFSVAQKIQHGATKFDTLYVSPVVVTDTLANKPVVMAANGKVFKMSYWPLQNPATTYSAANLGTGIGTYNSTSGTTFRFNSIKGLTNYGVTATQNGNDIELKNSAYYEYRVVDFTTPATGFTDIQLILTSPTEDAVYTVTVEITGRNLTDNSGFSAEYKKTYNKIGSALTGGSIIATKAYETIPSGGANGAITFPIASGLPYIEIAPYGNGSTLIKYHIIIKVNLELVPGS